MILNFLFSYFYKFWIYLLNSIHVKINNLISIDLNNLYVVYLSNSSINKDVYICPDGKSALELVELFNTINKKLRRDHFVTVLYGPAKNVFKFKVVKMLDLVFTWDATEEQRLKIFQYIPDIPITVN